MNIAFIGEQCAGKTTAANTLLSSDKTWKKIAKFIEPIYKINEILGVDKNRIFMQEIGELIRREFGEDFFVNRFKLQYKGEDWLLCDDVRKIIEFETIKEFGFITVYIDADEEIRIERSRKLGLVFNPNHAAEQEIRLLRDKCDYIIQNNTNNPNALLKQILRIVFVYHLNN